MACGTTTAYRNGCRCDACRAAQSAYNAAYHKRNRAKLNAKALARRDADPERWRQAFRDWRDANLERSKKRCRDYYWADTARARARSLAWKRRNPARNRASSIRYHWRSRMARGAATAGQIAARVAFFGGVCSYCGGKYEALDHAIPLSRGGTNWPANLRPACFSCNSSKCQLTAVEFIFRAVKRVQATAGLAADGVVGPKTFAVVSWMR